MRLRWPDYLLKPMNEKTTDNLTILLVEDDEDTRYLMRLELERRGYRLIEAADGERAVALAQEERPDIILMDISLPRMDGLEATKLIRNLDRMRAIPVVAVTAHQESDVREGAKASGFDAYVTKPIDFDWLSELIVGLIG
jgi:CheY-like chemotaxis protein